MAYRINPLLGAVAPPPIAEAHGWVAGRAFPPEKPLLDLAQAVPAWPPDATLVEHLAAAARLPDTARYTEILGRPALRRTLAAEMASRYGGAVEPRHVAITAGCNQAFCLAMMALARPGDSVLLPVPYYFNHRMWLEMLGVEPVPLPFRPDRGGMPDPADAERLIGPATRAIVLVTPNNPTGAVYAPETVRAFRDLAVARGLALVLDETYRDFLPGDGPPHDLFADADWEGTLIHLYSFSKAYALAGYRVGALAASEAFLAEVAKAADCVAICAPAIAQEAAQFGLENLTAFRAEKRRLALERAAGFRAVFARNDLAYTPVSTGAFFAYVRHPFGDEPATSVARRLAERQNLLCLPGSMFGPGQDAYLRFALANIDGDAMEEVGRRLAASQE